MPGQPDQAEEGTVPEPQPEGDREQEEEREEGEEGEGEGGEGEEEGDGEEGGDDLDDIHRQLQGAWEQQMQQIQQLQQHVQQQMGQEALVDLEVRGRGGWA